MILMSGCFKMAMAIWLYDIHILFSSAYSMQLFCQQFMRRFVLHLYVSISKSVHRFLHCICVEEILQASNPTSAISEVQFSLNPDELLMPTFCFLLMGKSFEMDFFGAANEFISCLRCQYDFPTFLL